MGRVGRSTKLTPAVVRRLVRSFKLGATDKIACGAAGIHPGTYYRWMQQGEQAKSGLHREFYETVTRAKSAGDDELLAYVRKSIKATYDSPSGAGGKLALDLLARRNPDAYGAHKTVRHASHDGGPVPRTEVVDLSKLSPEQLRALVGADAATEDDDYEAAYNDASNSDGEPV